MGKKKEKEVGAELLDDDDEDLPDVAEETPVTFDEPEVEETEQQVTLAERKKLLQQQLKEIETYESETNFIKDAPKLIDANSKKIDGLIVYVRAMAKKQKQLEENLKLILDNKK